jgi:tungstate transport system ATP-binding protein
MPEAAVAVSAAPAREVAHARPVLPIAGSGLVVRRGGRTLVDGIDIAFEGRGLTVVMGANGAGKSLLLRLLAGLVRPDAGTVTWAGAAPDRARALGVGFVFQRPIMLRRTAGANVRYALKAAGVPRAERDDLARHALEGAGLAALADWPARLLSGGEQQRVALARALAPAPQALLLDEPTSNLDPASTLAIENLVRGARQAGTRVVLVTHDLGQARRLADEVVFLHAGRVLERSPAETFFHKPSSGQAQAFLEGRIVL